MSLLGRLRSWLTPRRVFISYGHKDVLLRKELTKWLEDHGFVAEYDETTVMAGKYLEPELKKKIKRSDCVIALGTRDSFFRSRWVEAEVRFIDTLSRKPTYLPILAEDISEEDIPEWFTMTSPLMRGVVYLKCLSGDFEALASPIEEVCCGRGLPPAVCVFIALALLIAVPLLISWSLRPFVDAAGGHVRELQRWVEGVNRDIQQRQPPPSVNGPRLTFEDSFEVSYMDPSRALFARDVILHGALSERHFYRLGKEVARDVIVVHAADKGVISQVKTRQIFPDGAPGQVVEDTFDSDGNLVSKRMKVSASEPWTYYAERGRSIYAPFPLMAAYR